MNLLRRIIRKILRITKSVSDKLLQVRVKREKDKRSRNGYSYMTSPGITFIVQVFNKKSNMRSILESLRLFPQAEIIVIDDGSIDGTYKECVKYLERPNDFLLRSNDLFEVRTYERALRMANGEICCLLQDDDILPKNKEWVEQALSLFDIFPDLVILGGRKGLDIMMPDSPAPRSHPEYKRSGPEAGCPGVNKYRVFDVPIYREPKSGIPFMFATFINRAPMFVRKKIFLETGGMDQEFAPFQCDDVDASIRTWIAGYKVGFYDAPFDRDQGGSGMEVFNRHERALVQIAANWKKIYDRYGSKISGGELQRLVNNANSKLEIRFHSQPEVRQDQWVIEEVFPGKRDGYFVEVGSSDGIHYNNTYVLEKIFDWRGICIEPNKTSFEKLKNHRNCICDNALLGDAKREVEFVLCGEGSGIKGYFDKNKYLNLSGNMERKKTELLADVLRRHSAPAVIDYLSIDTEGTEYLILKNFRFDEYKFLAITVEHNRDAENRKNIRRLLEMNGYVFARQSDSYGNPPEEGIDDFYIHRDILKR